MNSKTIYQFQLFSIIFSIILGTLLHFTFKWSGYNKFVASFSSVNESVWEHLKLVFFPMLITTIIGYFIIGKSVPNYLCSKTMGILSAIFFITVFFYTYTGIIGTNFTFLDISSFFVAVILGEYVSFKLFSSNFYCNNILCFIILFLLLISFIFFTYFPPEINYFKQYVPTKK